MSGETRFSVGFPFMRRMGSQALAAVGPVVNVLPLLLNVTPEMSLADVCLATVAQIKLARRHQRYEAEQIKRDLGLVGGHQELYGPVVNVKVYHSALSFDGQAATTHTLAMGPVDDRVRDRFSKRRIDAVFGRQPGQILAAHLAAPRGAHRPLAAAVGAAAAPAERSTGVDRRGELRQLAAWGAALS